MPNLQLIDHFARGVWLAGSPDAIPDDALRLGQNVRLDRELGAISSRPGVTQSTTAVVNTSFLQGLWLSKLFGVSADYSYAQFGDGATSVIYRLNDAWADASKTLLLSPASVVPVSEARFVDGNANPYLFFVGPAQRKDNGTTLSNFGIAAPTQAPDAVVLGTSLRTAIQNFDDQSYWTGSGIAGQANEANIKQEGVNALTFTVAANTLGSVGLGFTGGRALASGSHNGAANSLFLQDTGQNFATVGGGVKLGSRVRNTSDGTGSEGIVTRIGTTSNPNDTMYFDAGMSGGTDNDWDVGDLYEVYFNLDTLEPRIYTNPGDLTSSTTFTDNSGVSGKTNRTVVTSVNFLDLGVLPGMTIRNTANGCSATVTSVGTTTNTNDTIFFTPPAGSPENDFDTGDTFIIVNDLVKDDDFVHLQVRFNLPERVEYIQIDADLDTATYADAFRTNYYTLRVAASSLTQGRDVWTELFIRKADFSKVGTSTANWSAVRAWRISIQTTQETGGVTCFLDDLSLVGGYGLEGDYEVVAIYRNSTTGGRSNPPLLGTAPDRIVGTARVKDAKRHPLAVTLTSLANPTDTQVDQIRIYLKGGSLGGASAEDNGWRLVDTIADSRTSYTIVKAESQIVLAEQLEEDNDLIPSTAVVLFGPGAHHRFFFVYDRNKVGFTKAWQREEMRSEQAPRDFYFLAGDGSSEAMNGIALDSQIFVYTEDISYEVVGTGEDTYLPRAIPGSRGLAARDGLTYGDGQLFMLARDGIYSQVGLRQTKLTGAIDPFFRGETVNGEVGISQTNLTTCRLKHFNAPDGPMVVLAYPQSGQSVPNRVLVLKKGDQGQYTEAFFDSYTDFSARALFCDYEENHLLVASSTGRVYRLEVPAQNSDAGTGILMAAQLKSYDQGMPLIEKTYTDLVVEANTGGQSLTTTLYYNKGLVTESLTAISSDDDQDEVIRTMADTTTRRQNIGVRFSGTLTAQAKIFKVGWHYIPEAEYVSKTDTDEISFATRHVIHDLFFDIDAPAAVAVLLYIDGVLSETTSVAATTGRQRVDLRFSDATLQRGLTFRVVLTSTGHQLYGLMGVFEPEPQQVTFYDSGWLSFDLVQTLKQLHLDTEAPANLTVNVYLDGSSTATDTHTFLATTNRQRGNHYLPAGIKGRSFRVTATSTSSFQVWSLQGLFKPLGTLRGYQPRSMQETITRYVERELLARAA